jgi:hypothetical protein
MSTEQAAAAAGEGAAPSFVESLISVSFPIPHKHLRSFTMPTSNLQEPLAARCKRNFRLGIVRKIDIVDDP